MKKSLTAALLSGAALLVAVTSSAHVSISSGPAIANTSQEVHFSVGHGCPLPGGGGNADTIKITVDIPDGVTSVRPMPNAFGKVTVAGNPVKSVTWEKASGDALPGDTSYYKFTIRLKAPDAPFTKVHFGVHQWCTGVPDPVHWTGLPGTDAGVDEPAAELVVMPARHPGWNKYTVPVDIKDLRIFKDALIVWRGNAAFSDNPNTAAQIAAEAGATPLTELKANDEIWVKY
ncbi:MAG TPA: DUF1775 domain-containing protein [Labilithrix sp.]|nr:DUF1775 domain-containing protein [Labilithrix sp.]